MQKSKRGVVLRILETARRLVKTRYGEVARTPHGKPRNVPSVYSAITRATELIEDTDREIGHYKEYQGTANAVIDHVQRGVLGTKSKPFWEHGDARNPEAKSRAIRILDNAIRVIKLDDKHFA